MDTAELKLVSPLLDGMTVLECLNSAGGFTCYLLERTETKEKFVLKHISIPESGAGVEAMILSGALCGLTGFLIVGGRDQAISTGTAGGNGFTAIIVAWLAKFNTFTMALISFLLIFLEKGAAEIASAYNLNDFASDIIAGVILFFILGSEFFINYKAIFRGHAGKEVC